MVVPPSEMCSAMFGKCMQRERRRRAGNGKSSPRRLFLPPSSVRPSFAGGAVGKFKLYLTGGNTLARSRPLRRLILPLNDMIFHAMHPSSCTEPEFITALHTYLGRHRPCLAIFLPPGARSLKSFCFLAEFFSVLSEVVLVFTPRRL